MLLMMSEEARTQLQAILERQGGADVGLRVYVSPGGCSGFSYGMSLEDQTSEDDQVFEIDGVKVVVDSFSSHYLDGAQIDYVDSLMGGGFRVLNPNAVKNCACGQSFDTAAGAGEAKPCH